MGGGDSGKKRKRAFFSFQSVVKYPGSVQAHSKEYGHILIPGGCLVEIWISVLASFGVFCVLWTAFGWLLSGGRGTVVCMGDPRRGALLARRLRLLRELGLFRGRLVLVTDEKDTGGHDCLSGVETVTWETFSRHIRLGAEEFGAAGDGDPSGHRIGGGLSEL